MKKIVFPQLEIGLAVKGLMFQCKIPCLLLNPGKMIPGKMVPGKNGPRKNCSRKMVLGKMVPEKNGPRKIGPRQTQKRKIVGWASSIVVCVCVECWDVINLRKPKTLQQTQNTETKNRGVRVEHRGVYVECSDVINLWKPKTRQQIFPESFSVLQFGTYVGSWRKRQTSFCVCSGISWWKWKSFIIPSILLTENNFGRTFFRGPIFRGPFFPGTIFPATIFPPTLLL